MITSSSEQALSIALSGPPVAFDLRLQFELRWRLPLARFQFPSASPDSTEPAWWEGATVLVIPHEEPDTLTLARLALEHGVPVVARTAGPLRELVGGGGLALPPAAGAAELAEAAASLLADPAEYASCQRRALAQARRWAGRKEAGRGEAEKREAGRTQQTTPIGADSVRAIHQAPGTPHSALPGASLRPDSGRAIHQAPGTPHSALPGASLRPDSGRVIQRGPPGARPALTPATACVILCHNYGRYLAQCLESCLVQSTPFAEILVVDNHSSDDTRAVAERFRHRGVDYVHGNWSTFTAARNAGAALVRPAEYLLFVDADNWLDSAFHERLRPALAEDPGCAVSYPHLRLFEDGGNDLGLSPLIRAFDYDALRHANLADACALIRRAAREEVGGWVHEPWGHTDWHLWLRLTRHGWKMQWEPEAILHYRVHPNAMSARLAGTLGAGLSVARGAMALCLILVLSGDPADWEGITARLALSSWRRENVTVIALSPRNHLARSEALGREFTRMGVSYTAAPVDYPLLDLRQTLTAVRPHIPGAADLVWLPLDPTTADGDFLEGIAGTLLNVPGVPCMAYRLVGMGCTGELAGILSRRPDWEALFPLPTEAGAPPGFAAALVDRLPEHTLECWLPPPEPSFPQSPFVPYASTCGSRGGDGNRKHPASKLSILLLLSGDTDQTKACLNSLCEDLSSHFPGPAEILCVDDGNSAAASGWLRSQPDLNLLAPTRGPGRAAACNDAFHAAAGDVLCVLSSGAILRPGGILALVGAAEEVGISAQGGGMLTDEMNFAGRTDNPARSDYPEATALAVRRDVWDRVGPFDEGMLLSGGEDADWGMRARALGYEWVILPDVATLVETANTPPVPGMREAQAYNRLRLATRWGTRIRMLRR